MSQKGPPMSVSKMAALASFQLNADALWVLTLVREQPARFGELLDQIYTHDAAMAGPLFAQAVKDAGRERGLGAAFKASMIADTLSAEQVAPLLLQVASIASPYSRHLSADLAGMPSAGRA